MTVLGKRLGQLSTLRTAFAAVLTVGCLLFASVGSAQPTNTVKAREAYARGQQLFRQGDFVGAQTAFEVAYEAVPNPIVLLSIAECQVRTEQYAWALVSLNRYLTERPTAPDKAQVEAQIAKLREKPGFVNVVSRPLGAAVFVDGVDTGKTTPVELPLESGDHVIFLELEGYRRGELPVAVVIGSRQTVEVALEAPTSEHEALASAPGETKPGASAATPNRTPIWIAAGLTGAGLLTGAVLGGLALKNKGDFDDKPTAATADKGERLALFADVGFGVAAAAAVTGLVLYLTEDETPSEQAFQVAPSVARGQAGLVGNLRF